MKNKNPWAFAMVFIGVFIFLSFNETNFKLLFSFNKEETNAVILKTKIGYGMTGRGYTQTISYFFVVKGKVFKGEKTIGNKYVLQKIGNTLKVEYSSKNPSINQVLYFNNESENLNLKEFINSQATNYSEYKLKNGIYYFEKYSEKIFYLGEQNQIKKRKMVFLGSDFGIYKQKNDSLILKSNFNNSVKKFIENKKNEIINIETNEIYN